MSWNNAVEEVKRLLKENTDFVKSFFASKGSGSFSSDSTKNTFTKKNGYEFDSSLDLLNFFAESLSTEEKLKQNGKLWESSIMRGFADIAREGPQNVNEYNLYVAAAMFLEPHEFKECIDRNIAPTEVMAMIQASQQLREMQEHFPQMTEAEKSLEAQRNFSLLESLVLAEEKGHEHQNAKDNDMMEHLGEEYGVTAKIQELLGKPIIGDADLSEGIKTPKTPETEKTQKKEEGLDKGK